jgi:hypothetical protein
MATTQQSGSVAASAPTPDPEVPERARTRTFSPRYTVCYASVKRPLTVCGQGKVRHLYSGGVRNLSGWGRHTEVLSLLISLFVECRSAPTPG